MMDRNRDRAGHGIIVVSAALVLAALASCQPPVAAPPPPPPPPPPSASLKVASLQAPSSPVTSTATWTLGATVTNSGNATATASNLQYWISASSTLDSSATLIGSDPVPALAPGQSYTDVYSNSYSVSTPGTHYVFAEAVSASSLSAAVAVFYPRVVIETYDPTQASSVFTAPWISLFDSNGDTTADTNPNEWNNDAAPYTVDAGVAIAESGSAGSWVTIDFTTSTAYPNGLPPGTYYVRVRGAQTYQKGAYAIRFLSLPVGASLPAYPAPFTASTDDSPYEPDNGESGGIPTNPVKVSPGSVLNKALITTADTDWFKLVLP